MPITQNVVRIDDFRSDPPALVDADTDQLDLMGTTLTFERNREIYGEEEPAEFVYKVASGAVRIVKLLSDGRRQIGAFHLPGDFFGFEAGACHGFAAEAVVQSRIVMIRRSALLALAERNGEVARRLLLQSARSLAHAHDQMMLLGRKTAAERVAAFLLEMAEREEHERMVDLPMSRQDIADYLGLTIETVSRTITLLGERGLIEVIATRHIALRNRVALHRLHA